MLQVVAWSGMMVKFASTDGVVEAARKTFDGEHKCPMCKAIDASREEERKNDSSPKAPAPEWGKFGKELTAVSVDRVPSRCDRVLRLLPVMEPAESTSADPNRPPTPPPRHA